LAEELSIDRTKTAVLIMDFQNRQLNYFAESFQQEILQRANEVLDRTREVGIPVIHIEVVRGERDWAQQMHPGMVPHPGELVLTKNKVGPFSSTRLDEVLRQQGTDTLVLLGISTGGCVLTTVRCAADMDYKLIILSDCCADPDIEVHRVLMEKLFPRQANVITSGQFLDILAKL
jgi:nicotinamidase-related amidase